MSDLILHKANSRGNANHGWLQSWHTFSFANYHDEERMSFGVLRVLNDDTVAAGMGFGAHPHQNMEIISIPLEGDLEHKDSMGNETIIKHEDIQVMSAGTGIQHSEYNKNKDKPVKFLQIWVIPNKMNVTPRYDQITLKKSDRKNKLQQILSPNANDEGVWIHQNAWFHLADLESGFATEYEVKNSNNGVYVFVLSGDVIINNQELTTRDGLGILNTSTIKLEAITSTEILVMEVPMRIA
jgi:redox-sensitive bicupin YhaK (pirin superfamily)